MNPQLCWADEGVYYSSFDDQLDHMFRCLLDESERGTATCPHRERPGTRTYAKATPDALLGKTVRKVGFPREAQPISR